MTEWLLVSAGLGSQDFEASAERVALQSAGFNLFSKIVSLDTRATEEVCKRVKNRYPNEFSVAERGYGHMIWKSEIVLSALEGFFGDYENVFWVDGGCEVNPNFITRLRLKRLLKLAEKNGVVAFTLKTPEWKYSKSDLLNKFSHLDSKNFNSNQFQTTWFALSGKIGAAVASRWLEITLEDYAYSNVSPSKTSESLGFVENRYDQSIFSLVCKEFGIKPMRYTPVAGRSGFKSVFRALFHPIWTSRNRTGISIIPKWVRSLQSKGGN
jgi:hypothetical protein